MRPAARANRHRAWVSARASKAPRYSKNESHAVLADYLEYTHVVAAPLIVGLTSWVMPTRQYFLYDVWTVDTLRVLLAKDPALFHRPSMYYRSSSSVKPLAIVIMKWLCDAYIMCVPVPDTHRWEMTRERRDLNCFVEEFGTEYEGIVALMRSIDVMMRDSASYNAHVEKHRVLFGVLTMLRTSSLWEWQPHSLRRAWVTACVQQSPSTTHAAAMSVKRLKV